MTRKQPLLVATRRIDASSKRRMMEHGVEIDDSEFIDISYIDTPQLAEIFKENTHPLVFTSIHALRAAEHIIEKYNIELRTRSAYCIEGRTSSYAEQAGFTVIAKSISSSLLADSIIADRPRGLLYSASAYRRKEMEEKIKNADIFIETQEIYAKRPNGKRVDVFDGMIFFSPSQADVFFSMNEVASHKPAFCIGRTTANHARALRHRRIIVAKTPSEGALVEEIIHYFNV